MKDSNFKVYKYNIELSYEYDKKETKLKFQNTSTVSLLKNYVNYHRPILYMTVMLDKRLADDMIKNMNNKYIKLKIEKISVDPEDTEKPEKIKQLPKIKMVEGEFIYVIPSGNINRADNVDYGGENKDRKDLFIPVMIGLVHPNSIKLNEVNNKNTYYYNTRVQDAILHRCEHVDRLIFQPVDTNPIINNTPSCDTVTEFLFTLHKKGEFYSGGYRMFFDFDYSYLVGNSGRLTRAKGDSIDSIIFKCYTTDKKISRGRGMFVDLNHRSIKINVDSKNIEPIDDRVVDKSIESISDASIKGIDPKKKMNENNPLDIIRINKADLDISGFTINKEYFIDNYEKLYNKRGRFILLSANSVFTNEGEFFNISSALTFRFVKFE